VSNWPVTPPPERRRSAKKDPLILAAEAKLKTLRRRELPPRETAIAPKPTWAMRAMRHGRLYLRGLTRAVLIGIGQHYVLVGLGIGSGGVTLWQVWEYLHPKPAITDGWNAEVHKAPRPEGR
jgi:hypothetical protein